MKTIPVRQIRRTKAWKKYALYPYIYAWGQYMGSYEYYILKQIDLAIEMNAPKDAIFFTSEPFNMWSTISDIKRPELINWLNELVRHQFPNP